MVMVMKPITAALSVILAGLTSATDVSVQYDAVYSIPASRGPLCSGSGPAPAGTACPLQGCCYSRLYSKVTIVQGGKCVAPVDAECTIVSGTSWGCAFTNNARSYGSGSVFSDEEKPPAKQTGQLVDNNYDARTADGKQNPLVLKPGEDGKIGDTNESQYTHPAGSGKSYKTGVDDDSDDAILVKTSKDSQADSSNYSQNSDSSKLIKNNADEDNENSSSAELGSGSSVDTSYLTQSSKGSKTRLDDDSEETILSKLTKGSISGGNDENVDSYLTQSKLNLTQSSKGSKANSDEKAVPSKAGDADGGSADTHPTKSGQDNKIGFDNNDGSEDTYPTKQGDNNVLYLRDNKNPSKINRDTWDDDSTDSQDSYEGTFGGGKHSFDHSSNDW
ncbi:unnamed protein product [Phytophthora lilii]|uniref:Unnamed protein product n=1 Tax=Phytophthora lilii TaxID=2077276 RepID=A0A9W6U702_9STRA|nr:unnamed protein product [Phytophthora lilii]